MKKPLKFSIGDCVLVTKTVQKWEVGSEPETGYTEYRRTFLERPANVRGFIVGAQFLRTGISRAYSNGRFIFYPSGTKFVYLVRYGVLNKPVHVEEKDMTRIDKIKNFPLLWRRK